MRIRGRAKQHERPELIFERQQASVDPPRGKQTIIVQLLSASDDGREPSDGWIYVRRVTCVDVCRLPNSESKTDLTPYDVVVRRSAFFRFDSLVIIYVGQTR